jgi:hypothetical protein
MTPQREASVDSNRKQALRLLDRSLIGLLVFIVMLLLGIHAVQAG